MGGLGIVFCTCAGVAYYLPLTNPAWILIGAAFLLGMVGLLDDLHPLSPGTKLLAQLMVCGGGLVGVLMIVPFSQWRLGAEAVYFSPLWVLPVVFIALLWWINLFNFMDGTDGFAASQALFCVLVVLLLYALPEPIFVLGWILAGALAGFMLLNWPPARIFMGDTGSGFVGVILGLILLLVVIDGVVPLPVALILLSPFWVDASYTLVVRWLRGERLSQAHRSHAYQHMAKAYSHLVVVVVFWVYGLCWLLPMVGLVFIFPAVWWLWLQAAVAPLLLYCWYFRSGFDAAT